MVHISGYDDQGIELICDFLNEQLGFTYGLQKKYLVNTRLTKRLNELNLTSYRDYLALIKTDFRELNQFFDLLTTNVTSFFREDTQFHILQHELLPSLMNLTKGSYKLRCWSAGCSSGEEPYTLAIVLQEALGEKWDIRVLASDISIGKLKEGMNGIYHEDKLRDVPAYLRIKYFRPVVTEKGYFRVIPELRRQVVFRKINLNEDFEIPDSINFDLILCRNVFIYLAQQTREKVLNRFFQLLKKDGFLFVGQSEPIGSYTDPRWRSVKSCIYQKNN